MRPDRTKPTLFTAEMLIDHLEKRYPAECIAEKESFEMAHRRAGQREVVEYVLWLKEVNDDELPDIFEVSEKE